MGHAVVRAWVGLVVFAVGFGGVGPWEAMAGGTMYWTDIGISKIQRVTLEGTDLRDLVATALRLPRSIAIDEAGGKIYWMDSGTRKLQRAKLDGSGVEDLITKGLSAPGAIALDVAGGKIYWTDSAIDKIQRAKLDGSGVEDLVTRGLSAPWALPSMWRAARCIGRMPVRARSSGPSWTAAGSKTW
jgi:DNA-binding beta-propeller fold protein YncE